MLLPQPIFYPTGDNALTIQWGNTIDEATNDIVIQLFHNLQQSSLPYIIDIIPAYNSLTIVYNVVELNKNNITVTAFNQIKTSVLEKLQYYNQYAVQSRLIKIPVCYHSSVAPDLSYIANQTSLSEEKIIQLHVQPIYKVFMIGFLPGFPYMASVDERIRIKRKSTPSIFVPKGSVGIAGEQTGIYPLDSPGGWQLIGQTPFNIFDVTKEIPCLLQPGDTVQFNSISLDEFKQIKKEVQ